MLTNKAKASKLDGLRKVINDFAKRYKEYIIEIKKAEEQALVDEIENIMQLNLCDYIKELSLASTLKLRARIDLSIPYIIREYTNEESELYNMRTYTISIEDYDNFTKKREFLFSLPSTNFIKLKNKTHYIFIVYLNEDQIDEKIESLAQTFVKNYKVIQKVQH